MENEPIKNFPGTVREIHMLSCMFAKSQKYEALADSTVNTLREIITELGHTVAFPDAGGYRWFLINEIGCDWVRAQGPESPLLAH